MSDELRRPRRALAWPLIALGAIVLIVVLIVALRPGPDGGAERRGIVAGQIEGSRFRVTGAQPLPGTNFVEIDIGTGDYGRGSFDSSSSPMYRRNIVLLDRTSGAARRLLPDNSRVIRGTWFLPAQANFVGTSSESAMQPGEDAPAPAYFILLVSQAGSGDRQDLLVGSLAGPEQGFVMQGIDGIDAVWMQSTTQIGLLVRERQNLFYRIVDIPTLRVVGQHRVAI